MPAWTLAIAAPHGPVVAGRPSSCGTAHNPHCPERTRMIGICCRRLPRLAPRLHSPQASSQRLTTRTTVAWLPVAAVRVSTPECNLKAFALKASADSICVREEDAQRPAAGHPGEEHAAASRRTRQLTQEALAHDCGINRTYLSAVERSERNISIDNVARIAKGLRLSLGNC